MFLKSCDNVKRMKTVSFMRNIFNNKRKPTIRPAGGVISVRLNRRITVSRRFPKVVTN